MKNYHFIGLGGIGMSSLARILMKQGHKVTGSDVTHSDLLESLKKEGAEVFIGHSSSLCFEKTEVIYSSAIQETNIELISAKKQGVSPSHRSDLLSSLMNQKKPLLITGTHGKTTTTALLSSVFLEANLDPTMVLGGYLRSLNTNALFGKSEYFIAEADESDGSFLKTNAFGAIITNIGRDHFDYWKTQDQLNQGFTQFISQVQNQEYLFWCYDSSLLTQLRPKGISYGFSSKAQLQIFDFRNDEQGIVFSIEWKGKKYIDIQLALFGRHNALNGAAVFGLSLSFGISEEKIRKAFQQFSGTGRRLELKGQSHQLMVYDDYAHHPTEIIVSIQALRAHIHEKRLVVIFQPHRYSRVADLWSEFFSCFELADLVILTDIYEASEKPIEGKSTEQFYEAMKEILQDKIEFIPRKSLEIDLIKHLKLFDIVLTMGAGDITHAGLPILKNWEEKAPKLKIALLYGGTSSEHEISAMSANHIQKNLDSSLYDIEIFGVTKQGEWLVGDHVSNNLKVQSSIDQKEPRMSLEVLKTLNACDVAIPVFHGPEGEDGMMQGFLDTLQIPYVGCGYRGSVVCMQKAWTKYLAVGHGVPTAPFLEINKFSYLENPIDFLRQIEELLKYPVWVKPVHLGSSIGVSRVVNREELNKSIELAFICDERLIVEKEIQGRQIEFAVLGNEKIRVLNSCEILNHGTFYDYNRKYGENAIGTEIPANLTSKEKIKGFDLAKQSYLMCDCKGMARVDFFLDEEGNYWLNEINPFPGFTAQSGYPKMCEAVGLTGQSIWNELISLSFHRARTLSRMRVVG